MKAHYHLLPDGLLLTLCGDHEENGRPLPETLAQARCHGHQLVWVDCRRVPVLSTESIALLQEYASLLWLGGGHLLLCHLPAAARASLAGSTTQPLAAGLLDAITYGLDCPPAAYLR